MSSDIHKISSNSKKNEIALVWRKKESTVSEQRDVKGCPVSAIGNKFIKQVCLDGLSLPG